MYIAVALSYQPHTIDHQLSFVSYAYGTNKTISIGPLNAHLAKRVVEWHYHSKNASPTVWRVCLRTFRGCQLRPLLAHPQCG